MTTNESACSTDCEPSTDDRLTTDESACATDCELTTDTTYPTRPATENENPNEASEDANETTNETSEDVSENSNEGRVNAAILESQPNVSVRHITIVYEVFGLGRSARRRTDLKGGGGATSSDASDPLQRGEGQVENETEPALSTLDSDAALAYMERVGSVTKSPSEEEIEDLKPLDPEGPGPPLPKKETIAIANPEYASLFTPDELDALEAGRPSPATEVKEEYDKELEGRLFPLDEVELKKMMTKNAAKKKELIKNAATEKELSMEELSSLLNLSVDTLARTRESHEGELSAPEYWSAWYHRTLVTSESESSDDRDVRGGGHVCEVSGLHSGGLVPVGENLPSDSVLGITLENVGQGVGAREYAVHVYEGASVEVGELLGLPDVLASGGYAESDVGCHTTLLVDALGVDKKRFVGEHKHASWTRVLIASF
ncbi:hypothetical protein PF004_g18543, partial [Phytophthora fragariae]